jgi:hypothetical protein
LDVHGFGEGYLSHSLLNPFVVSPVFYFPDFLTLGSPRRDPFRLLHLTEQLSRLDSNDQLNPSPLLDLIDGGGEIRLRKSNDPRDEQITDSIASAHDANRIAISRESNKDASFLIVQFKRRPQPQLSQLGLVIRIPILDWQLVAPRRHSAFLLMA